MKRLLWACLLPLALPSSAQETFAYQQPSAAVRAVLDAAPLPTRVIDPTGRTLASLEVRRYPTVEELARPFVRLAGMRIDPVANGPHRIGHLNRLSLRELAAAGASERVVALPAEGDFYGFSFSPDGKRFILLRRTPQATELWAGDTAQATAKPVAGLALQNASGQSVEWTGASTLLAKGVSRDRGPAPASLAPVGPVVQESYGRRSPAVTYQDLLRTPADEQLFDYYMASQLVRIDLASGEVRRVGKPAIYDDVKTLGDGSRLLVERVVKPYSYTVPFGDFAKVVEVVDLEGRVVRTVGKVALKVDVPVQGVIRGPRGHSASALADGRIFWLEALDEGDPRKKVPHRDRLMRLDPPYTGEPVEIVKLAHRFAGMVPLEDGRALVTEFDRDRFWVRTHLVDASKPGADTLVLFDLSARDRYNSPGRPLTRVRANGRAAAPVVDGQVLYVGPGASPTGDRPFLDRWNLAAKTRQRLFQSSESHHENVIFALEDSGQRFVTLRESRTEPPDLMLREDTGRLVALTRTADPTPQIRDIQRELVKFKRKDGVEQSFWLYRPRDLKPGEKRPGFLWAYPLEFTDPTLASQVQGSPNRFEELRGPTPLFLVLDGFVVLNDVTMPVVGDPEKVNDTFVEQISMNAEAAIGKAAELGVVDPKRVAVGGHSYGAFMTANLLAHTDLFKTGIARSGAYNRTLTPFGFQSERRTLWEAPSAYLKLSPFLAADKLKEPILLIHGEVDNNPGTYPDQSDRLFAALAGTGGHVRYVKLPAESHGYAARESVGHTLWEMSGWLRRHLGDPRAPN